MGSSLLGRERGRQILAMVKRKLSPIHLMMKTLLHLAMPGDWIPDWE